MLGRIIVALASICLTAAPAAAQQVREVRTGFEDAAIPPEFVICHRPENRIEITSTRARSGRNSLSLVIEEGPLFRAPPDMAVGWAPSAVSCLLADQTDLYRSDDVQRAELWENKAYAPMFGQEAWYGFSMWVEGGSAPYGDFNRVVLGQWKASYEGVGLDYSPFLAQRLTGGFYHITLDVDAARHPDDGSAPKTCRLLLAFAAGPPSSIEKELALDRPVICETRLRDRGSELAPAHPVEIERTAYLPRPFDRWTDLVFRVKGGPNGIVQVWADGVLVATARGWIGHEAAIGTRQYFKFGPYRDPAANKFLAHLDNLARGNSRSYVDSAGSHWLSR